MFKVHDHIISVVDGTIRIVYDKDYAHYSLYIKQLNRCEFYPISIIEKCFRLANKAEIILYA